jgi:predicted AAA+ superfamily ATPase
LAEFKQYLKTGYYPYYFEINDEAAYWVTVEQNFHATLDSDLPSVYPSLTHVSIAKIKRLLKFISSCVPFTPNWESLKNELDMGDVRTVKNYFKYLEDAGLIRSVRTPSMKLNLEKTGKVFLNNSNQMYAMNLSDINIGTLRETFFLSMLSQKHEVKLPETGDFLVDKKLFEVGGKNKGFEQIKGHADAFLACDDLELGIANRIPLWMFGLLY